MQKYFVNVQSGRTMLCKPNDWYDDLHADSNVLTLFAKI